jgi:hypothetical protein
MDDLMILMNSFNDKFGSVFSERNNCGESRGESKLLD